MTIWQLRRALLTGPKAIEWTKSKIVEVARLQENGAIQVHNVISGKTFILPIRPEHHLRIINSDELVTLGQLIPKGK